MHDVAIVGAGPVGATLACALAGSGLDVAVVDARARGATPRGERALALSHGARLILERLGVWPALASEPRAITPITAIDVSQARGFGATRLSGADVGLPALGYVVSYVALQQVLDDALAAASVAVRHGSAVERIDVEPGLARVVCRDGSTTIEARVAAVADGAGELVSGIRRVHRDYAQVALIADVARATPQDGVAYERFTPQGPVALLPKGDRYGLVWTMSPARAAEVLALDDAAFIDALARHAGHRIGRIVAAGPRRTFPLTLEFAKPPAVPRAVMLGNASQTLHPVAGQGFNMGLRDAFELARVILDTPRESIGARPMIDAYLARRRADRHAGIAFTDGLTRMFGGDTPLLAWPRGTGLALLDAVPPLRRAFTRAMLFGIR